MFARGLREDGLVAARTGARSRLIESQDFGADVFGESGEDGGVDLREGWE